MAPHIAATLRTATTADLLDVPLVRCETCNGAGHAYSDNGPAPRVVTCWDCEGAGSWEGDWRCYGCDAVRDAPVAFCMSCRDETRSYIG